jgi:hypothetical protein
MPVLDELGLSRRKVAFDRQRVALQEVRLSSAVILGEPTALAQAELEEMNRVLRGDVFAHDLIAARIRSDQYRHYYSEDI